MKGTGKTVVSVLICVICLGLLIPAYFFWRDNKISNANRLRSKAEDEYFRREFLMAYVTYRDLIDSLGVQDDAASMNYANSAFMSSKLLAGGVLGSAHSNKPANPGDAATNGTDSLYNFSQSQYSRLTDVDDGKIASVAYNQLGYSALRVKPLKNPKSLDSAMTVALEHFKNALRRNPDNDSARYNYELLKKIVDLPATIMRETQDLVNQKRYQEAAELLEASMKKSPALAKEQEYLSRLKQIVKIDSIYARTR